MQGWGPFKGLQLRRENSWRQLKGTVLLGPGFGFRIQANQWFRTYLVFLIFLDCLLPPWTDQPECWDTKEKCMHIAHQSNSTKMKACHDFSCSAMRMQDLVFFLSGFYLLYWSSSQAMKMQENNSTVNTGILGQSSFIHLPLPCDKHR